MTRLSMLSDVRAILVVENDPTLRATIAAVLTGRYLIDADAADAVAALVDVDATGGLSTIRMLRATHGALPVIALTEEERRDVVLDALTSGAAGVLAKDRIAAELADAVDAVQSGGTPLSPRVASHVVNALRDGIAIHRPQPVSLTQAEHRVLEQLARGLTYGQVGLVLDVTINTVRTRVRTIYEKLGAMSRTEAVVTAARLGLIRIDA